MHDLRNHAQMMRTPQCLWPPACAALLLLVGVPASLPAATAGVQTASANTNILVGLVPGPEGSLGQNIRDGAQLAVEQANRTPGLEVNLITRGWGAAPSVGAQEAARQVLAAGATGLIAPVDTDSSVIVLQQGGRAGVAVASLCGDSSVRLAGIPWFARLVPRTSDEARTLFSYFSALPVPITRWTAFIPPGAAGREISNDLKQAAVMTGCSLDRIVELPAGTNETAITQALGTNTGGVLIWLEPKSAAQCVRALKLAGFSGALAGPARLHSPDFLAQAGSSLEGFVLPGLLLGEASRQRFQAFQVVFRKQFKREPDVMAAFSFDAVALLVQTLRMAEPGRPPRSSPEDFTFPGVSGILAFDKEGKRKLVLEVLVYINGSFVSPGESNEQ